MPFRIEYLGLAAAVIATPAWGTVYMTVQQAQAQMFPGQVMHPASLTLSPVQMLAIRKASGEQPLSRQLNAWRAPDGGWFIVDEVVGKHEFITYAVALDHAGSVRDVEIMEYKETYGGQVRDPRWRQQFVGKRPGQSLRLGADIKNISGATLSSKHVTDGVRRVLATYELVLAHA